MVLVGEQGSVGRLVPEQAFIKAAGQHPGSSRRDLDVGTAIECDRSPEVLRNNYCSRLARLAWYGRSDPHHIRGVCLDDAQA